tara:strand:+ start:3091 stop:3261 length:171 start_codon:yes stop_codon:yes gene_type:complete
MTAEIFLDKLDRFIVDTIGKEFEYRYDIDEASGDKQGVWFKEFYILGFDPEEDEDA